MNGIGTGGFPGCDERFDVAAWGILAAGNRGQTPLAQGKGNIRICFGGRWYCLRVKSEFQSNIR